MMLDALAASVRSYELVPIETVVPGFPLQPRIADNAKQAHCRRLYFDEIFSRGDSAANFIYQETTRAQLVVSMIAVERPQFRSPCLTLGRPLRSLIYAVLNNAVGIGAPAITEFCRRHDELHAALISVRAVTECLTSNPRLPSPLLLAPFDDRLSSLAGALGFSAPSPRTDDSPYYYLPLVLALRHIQSHARVASSRSMLVSAIATAVTLSSPSHYYMVKAGTKIPRAANVEHIKSSLELVQTLHYPQILMAALLLAQEMTPCHLLFDGGVLHAFLSKGVEVEEFLLQVSGETGLNATLGLLDMVQR
ncbi:BQ2448_3134 [Microbotryum intermedium]|uniref:BQ2448_3134 protein n=1 Tax=Microbotryum intermedium TaxID=269621 RepID=A0A238FKF2_9BASI|nr:BQ2448_3134 [Microbotryum intermedium]